MKSGVTMTLFIRTVAYPVQLALGSKELTFTNIWCPMPVLIRSRSGGMAVVSCGPVAILA